MPNYREMGGPRSASLHDALSLVMGDKWNLSAYQDFGVYLESRRAVYLAKLAELDAKQVKNAERWFAEKKLDPAKWNAAPLTVDWGREAVYRFEAPVSGTITLGFTPGTTTVDLAVLGAD